MERVDRFFDRASPYMALTGIGVLFVALVLFLAGGELLRYAPYTAAIGVVLMLDFVIVQRQQVLAALSGRSARYGGNAVVMSIAVLGILVLINVIAVRFNQRLDLTQNKQFTLSQQTSRLRGLSATATPMQTMRRSRARGPQLGAPADARAQPKCLPGRSAR